MIWIAKYDYEKYEVRIRIYPLSQNVQKTHIAQRLAADQRNKHLVYKFMAKAKKVKYWKTLQYTSE